MTFERAVVDAAVEDVAGFLRADGADLLVRDADPRIDRIHLALVVDDVSCAECVLAPDDLRATIADALQRRIPGEFELILDDPRRAP
jgi:Fe-S cluster biogenesis protein NfuA